MLENRYWSCSGRFVHCLRAAVLALFAATAALAQTPAVALEPLVGGLSQPVFLTHARDGTYRKFIIEQPGRILLMQPGASLTSVFLDIRNRVLSGGERGLLGLAFHPQFSANGRFFVNYTRQPDGATVVAEYRTSLTNPDQADAASEAVLIVVAQPYANHNGGMIEFGPDNFLYIGMGDGGSGNDPENRAQNLNELLGKILRIDVDHPAPGLRYSSPADNPFSGGAPGRDEIFAHGFRNPWRFSFDRFTGQLYAGDVGQNAREEVDVVVRGGNYGWRVLEGTRCTNLGPAACSGFSSIAPITEYATGQGGRCSVTGGYVYRGSRQSLPYGAYVFGDFCTGEIFMFYGGVQTLLLDTSLSISSFGQDETGELYVVDLGGTIQRIFSPNAVPVSQRFFAIPPRGGLSLPSIGAGTGLSTGYARIQISSGALPGGLAIFSLRRLGILTSEASIPSAPLIRSGRILATIGSATTTGIAIANPNSAPAVIDFYFTDAVGQDLGHGTTVIPPGQKIAAFLNESPFNGRASLNGTFTFSASEAIAAIGLNGTVNGRSEFLMTTLPIVPIDTPLTEYGVFPHWAHGAEWRTDFVLLNPSDQPITGAIQLWDPNGQLLGMLPYAVAAKSSSQLSPTTAVSVLHTGSARIVPAVGSPPAGIAVFRYIGAGIVATEAGVLAVPAGQAFRSYGEMSLAVKTGLAVSHLLPSPATAVVELTNMDGTSAGQGTISLPPSGHRALFLNEIPGLTSMTIPFQGMVRVTATSPVAVTSLRGRINERGDFLIAATPAHDESRPASSSELLFPHWALGGGYDMQFVLMDAQMGLPPSGTPGTLYFFDGFGQSLPLLLP